MSSKLLSDDLRAELLNPESWSSPLGRFARTTKMAVALTDREGLILGECQNPQPVSLLARQTVDPRNGSGCAFCVLTRESCSIVAQALSTGRTTTISDAAGFAHIAAPLFLQGEPLGAIIAGQVFIDYPQPLAVERMANQLGVPNRELWSAAIQRPPVRPAVLADYGELLESLGRALVGERYAVNLGKGLQQALDEKTILLQEVHHRVKNNMAVVSSLLGLQASSTTSEETAAHLKESQMRILSMASIHEHLYGSESLTHMRFDTYAKELAGQISTLFSTNRVRVEMNFSRTELSMDESVPCGLILNELLMNAFKYAFPDDRAGEVTIIFEVARPGVFRMSVEDDGVGFPIDSELAKAKTLGIRIVRTLTRQLSGTLELHQEGGTRFVITFPSERALPVG